MSKLQPEAKQCQFCSVELAEGERAYVISIRERTGQKPIKSITLCLNCILHDINLSLLMDRL